MAKKRRTPPLARLMSAIKPSSGRTGGKIGSISLVKKKHLDVFLSAPMASAGDAAAYKKTRNAMLKIMQVLKAEHGLKKIYYAGENIESPEDFDPANMSLESDLVRIAGSKYFILVVLDQFPLSSVFFEAGYALAMSKKSVYFVRDRTCLPFLMRQVDSEFENVRIHDNLCDFNAVGKLMGKNIFSWGEPCDED
jgi:hypothetical protein